jgi:hypothetical protein
MCIVRERSDEDLLEEKKKLEQTQGERNITCKFYEEEHTLQYYRTREEPKFKNLIHLPINVIEKYTPGLKEKKRVVWRVAYLENWDNAEQFISQCSAGGDKETWRKV